MSEATKRDARPGGLPVFGPRGEGWIGLQTALQLFILIAAPLTGPAWSGAARTVAGIAGFALLVAGIALFAWGAVVLGTTFSVWVAPRPTGHLATTGPYRFVRHPVCTAQVVILVGWSLVSASLLGLVLIPVLIWYLDRFKLRSEEGWLRATYPGYAAYAELVPHRMAPLGTRRSALGDGAAGA